MVVMMYLLWDIVLTGEYCINYCIGMEEQPIKRKYRRGATLKQIRAIQYKNQGMTTRQAMLKAGYSLSAAANPKRDLLDRPAVKQLIGTMWGELQDAGLTTQFMIDKFKEWLNAQKVVSAMVINPKGGETDLEAAGSKTNDFVEVPDYKTQLEAYKEWKKIADQERDSNTTGQPVRRRITLEEFIQDGDEGGVS